MPGASLSKRESLLKSTPLGWPVVGGARPRRAVSRARADPVESDAEPLGIAFGVGEWKGGHREIVKLLRSRGAGA